MHPIAILGIQYGIAAFGNNKLVFVLTTSVKVFNKNYNNVIKINVAVVATLPMNNRPAHQYNNLTGTFQQL